MLPTYDQAWETASEGSPFSNSDDGLAWLEANCQRCVNDKPAREGREENGCPLIFVSLCGRTPTEWTRTDKPRSFGENYRCMYFRDEEDGGDPEPQPIPDPPGQLTLAPREPFEASRMLTDYPVPAEVPA
jgi:hypothetical protein